VPRALPLDAVDRFVPVGPVRDNDGSAHYAHPDPQQAAGGEHADHGMAITALPPERTTVPTATGGAVPEPAHRPHNLRQATPERPNAAVTTARSGDSTPQLSHHTASGQL
jgi:hypothetical protein